MKLLKYIFLSLSLVVFFTACDDEDFTGDSALTPSSPSISVAPIDFTGPVSFMEEDSTFNFSVTLSEPQIVDVAVYIVQAGGTATAGADFTIDNNNGRVVIPAGRTSGVASVTILRDEAIEDEETLTIQIGDHRTANASITPFTMEFTIQDYDADALDVTLEWDAPTLFDSDGNELAATDVADLIFTLADNTGAAVSIADGAGFESLTIPSTLADGDYELRASIYGVVDPGGIGTGDYDIGVTVSWSQVGVQTGSFVYPAALNTLVNCIDSDYVVVANLTKSGSNYTLTEAGETSFAVDNPQDNIGGTYTEVNDDGTQQVATVTISAPDANGLFTITNFAFSSAWWCSHANATIDLVVDGTSIYFPDGGAGTPQAVGGIDNICGYSGPVVFLNEVGTWNPCSGVIEFNMEVTVDLGSFGDTQLTYTPQ